MEHLLETTKFVGKRVNLLEHKFSAKRKKFVGKPLNWLEKTEFVGKGAKWLEHTEFVGTFVGQWSENNFLAKGNFLLTGA